MPGEIHRISLRLPSDLHERLQKAAARQRRSLHAQLLVILERGLSQDEGDDHDGA